VTAKTARTYSRVTAAAVLASAVLAVRAVTAQPTAAGAQTGQSVGGPPAREPAAAAAAAAAADLDDGTFGISTPIPCREVRGFEDYEPRDDTALDSDEKLLLYFRPRNFKTAKVGDSYEVHLSEEGRLRRKGRATPLWVKPKFKVFRETFSTPVPIYVQNSVSLKDLKPGEYEFEITLHDKHGDGPPVVRTFPFRVKPKGETAAPAPGTAEAGGVR